ncbi:MAG TPA: glycosyltransferase family 2 protein [Longimicrobiaceae bacterium]|nr:glycosyltransferase family 2 protein [Longimicrobiaceae bacterium]
MGTSHARAASWLPQPGLAAGDSTTDPYLSALIAPLPLFLAVGTLLLVVVGGVWAKLGNRTVGFLRDQRPLKNGEAPSVSVVIAARDEERSIEEALRSVLRQEYEQFEVIVVDDRSRDATGAILDQVAVKQPRLHVVHVAELPAGWLGKNHALHCGTQRARGDVLLFTDADVVMEPTALARAVGFLLREELDHLAVAPRVVTRGALLDLVVGTFSIFFGQYSRPWKARDPRSKQHIGIGAFNLLRTEVYGAVGGHRPIAMRPDDDMKLGKLVKKNGYRQDVLFGRGMISVEWYASVRELIRGLEKNSFAAVDYSLPAVLASSVALLLFNVWPLVALAVTGGVTWLLNALIVLLMALLYADSTRYSGSRPELGVGFPLATVIFVYILWRSTYLTLVNRGIRWRGTHYPLEELRANRV